MGYGALEIRSTTGQRRRTPRFVTVVVSIALVAGGVFVVAPPASAAPVWSITPSANLSQSELAGVSCPSPTSCFAVGNYTDGREKTLVEHWNGTSWTRMTSPNPGGHSAAGLVGVSCPTPTSCFGVGTYLSHGNGLLYLYGVSCPGPKSCFAVGARASSPSLVEHWNGHGGWTFMTGAPPGLGGLAGVACAGPTDCVAVGGQAGGTPKSTALVEHWNGHGSWAAVTTPAPLQSGLVGVACPRAASCFAVGSRPGRSDSYRRTFVEQSA